MMRIIKVFLLGCLMLVGGVSTLFLTAWALVSVGGGGVAGEFVAVGLAFLLPCSFLAAGRVFPGPPRPATSFFCCPNCGMTFPAWGIHTRTD